MAGIPATGPFAPFRHRQFLAIWTANLVSSFGSLIQGVGASWLMTTIAPSADMVSLVQASTSLPIMLLSLAAGALADIRDRRQVMLVAQWLMLSVSTALALFAHLGWLTPWLLLTCTFLIGCGAALNGPAWQSSVGEYVPRADLPGAIALNSVGFNLARATGPAIGGVVVASAGPQAAFLLNAVTYVGLIVVLLRWRRNVPPSTLAPESLLPAMSAGLRYAMLSARLDRVLGRAFVFGLLAAVVWALLPLVARDVLAGGPLTYGMLLGAFGGGAVGGALVSARLRDAMSNERLVALASIAFGLGAIVAGLSTVLVLTMLGLFVSGACWVLALSTFNILVQLASPRWVVGRTMAVYQMATFGGLAVGSWVWGHVAEATSLPTTLCLAGGLLVVSVIIGVLWPVPGREAPDVEPSRSWPVPEPVMPVEPNTGPIVTVVEYIVPEEHRESFVEAMRELRRIRRRDGGHAWTLVQDMSAPERWIERFESPTWIDHLRHHERVTRADRPTEERVLALCAADTKPVVRHLVERPVTGGQAGLPRRVRSAATDPLVPAGIATTASMPDDERGS